MFEVKHDHKAQGPTTHSMNISEKDKITGKGKPFSDIFDNFLEKNKMVIPDAN